MKKIALPLAAFGAALLRRPASAATKQNLANNRRRTFAALLAATIVAVGLLSLTPLAQAQPYLWTNFAGKPGGPGNSDGTGAAATFDFLAGVGRGPDYVLFNPSTPADGNLAYERDNSCGRSLRADLADRVESGCALTRHHGFFEPIDI